MNEVKVARGLGWFSIGLGLTEVLAARSLGKLLGMETRTGLLRVFGLREIATGVGILSQHRPAPWLWARVGGDVLDLVALGSALTADESKKGNVGMAIGSVAAVTALDVMCGRQLSRAQ
jgi:hypothetical protein